MTPQRTRVGFGELKGVLIPTVNVSHFQDGHSEVQLWALGVLFMNSLPSSPLDAQGLLCVLVAGSRKVACSFPPNAPPTADTQSLELKSPCSRAAEQSLWKALETRTSEPKSPA